MNEATEQWRKYDLLSIKFLYALLLLIEAIQTRKLLCMPYFNAFPMKFGNRTCT